ncbi:uncharacterized protein BP5553_09573 [Venustampulla echinocandica]|uniref:Acyltransferase 3 domain-containing protein n=1 Tax=Venustampulla echinocandica TaxID=2656787 RepID=A0A370TBD2_9HELO|nr:uncharacterized protein BP5553_09573 [Venustampulla echinocandica]RDL31364.1 hypothetical protein BP5553_09573 [Venustampulla echinocandica]
MGYESKTAWSVVEGNTSPFLDWMPAVSSTSAAGKKLLQRTMFGLVPSFIQRRIRPLATNQQRLHRTSYLDGLRGVASFVVFMGHYTEENLGWYTEAYGLHEDGATSSPLQLPIIRVLYSARPMVHIFFIISGYVLAYKPLMQTHSQQYSALAHTLSSSIFRRALRLFLPSLITLFFMAVAVYSGLSDARYAPQFPRLSSQLQHWWLSCWDLSVVVWLNGIEPFIPAYNPALWTIPVEFTQSLLLFAVLLGLSRCIVNVRLLLLAGIVAFCFYSGQLYSVEFLGGMFIAEISLLNDRSPSPTSSPTLPKYSLYDENEKPKCGKSIKKTAMQAFCVASLVCGLFIASWTNNYPEEVWGIQFLNAHPPKPYEGQRVWFCLGAFQIVLACTQLQYLKDIFNTPIAQYLGNISYALYLTHNLCLRALEPRVAPRIERWFGKTTSTGRHLNWVFGLVIYLPIIIWVADVFWRVVDTPSVKFAKWLESKCIAEVEKMP